MRTELLPLVPVTASNLNDDDGSPKNDQQYRLAVTQIVSHKIINAVAFSTGPTTMAATAP